MPVDQSRLLTAETLGPGVHDARRFRQFSADEATVVRMYEDQDVSISVWNLEPGQENAPHIHPNRAHIVVVVEGMGLYLRGDADAVAIGPGQCVIAPRGVAHGFRNTGDGRLSYMIISNTTGGAYTRQSASG